jgi:putative membrane protein
VNDAPAAVDDVAAVRTPRRLSPLTPVVRAPIVVLAVVGASWRQLLDQGSVTVTGLVLLGLLVLGAIYGVVSWLRTRYWVDEDELRIDTGVVVRQSRRIRIDRLQGVDIVQPLVARLFGLAELRFDLASGGDREGKLAFLPHAEALEVRRVVLERRDSLRAASGPHDPSSPGAGAGQERHLARLDLKRLLASLALSGEAVVAVLGAVAFGGLAIVTGTPVVAAGALVPGALALVLSLGKRLTSYYNFTLSESVAGLHVRRGLTSLSSQTVAPARIQGYVVSEPLLWRPFGWARLEVSVAGYESVDPDAVQASSTLMPVAPLEEVLAVLRHVMGGRDVTTVPLLPPPGRAVWLAPLTSWNLALGQDDTLLVSRRGWWTRRVDVVPHERVQSLRASQGPLQRRLGLCDVHVDTPPGPLKVRGAQRDPHEAHKYLEAAIARGRQARRRAHESDARPLVPAVSRQPEPGADGTGSRSAEATQ